MDGDTRSCETPFSAMGTDPRWCWSCAHSHGPSPWADKPSKGYCEVYSREDGRMKPPDVLFKGARCPLYTRGDGHGL